MTLHPPRAVLTHDRTLGFGGPLDTTAPTSFRVKIIIGLGGPLGFSLMDNAALHPMTLNRKMFCRPTQLRCIFL